MNANLPILRMRSRGRAFFCLFLLVAAVLPLCWGCLSDGKKTLNAEDYPQLMRSKVVELARALRGRPYRSGGVEIDGWDCSGFVRYVFHAFGYEAPREARAYSKLKPAIRFGELKEADVLVFKVKRSWHVGLYTGKDRFVHAPSRGQTVREEKIGRYWQERLVKAVRVIRER